MAKRTKDTITIGSAIPYIMEYTGTMPTTEAICVPANRLGYIKGGASLEYTIEPYTEKDDLGYVSKTIVNAEEAVLKLGVLTWNGDTLQKLVDRCQVEEDKTNGVRTIKLGGAGNAQGKDWVICLHHVDKKEGDLWVMVRGTNAAGLTLTLSAEGGTVLEPEFVATAHDNKGTQVILIEEIDKTAAT
ncbi:MAG: hypothetical protein IKY91_06295 [Akkermansia sp.]|nr:hypothetical protein [Akkermansia sp.]